MYMYVWPAVYILCTCKACSHTTYLDWLMQSPYASLEGMDPLLPLLRVLCCVRVHNITIVKKTVQKVIYILMNCTKYALDLRYVHVHIIQCRVLIIVIISIMLRHLCTIINYRDTPPEGCGYIYSKASGQVHSR